MSPARDGEGRASAANPLAKTSPAKEELLNFSVLSLVRVGDLDPDLLRDLSTCCRALSVWLDDLATYPEHAESRFRTTLIRDFQQLADRVRQAVA